MGKRKLKYLEKLKKFRKLISSEYKIEKMILFGSRVTGKCKRYSDFDIVVISKKFRNMNRLDRPYTLYLKWNINKPVDFLCYTPEEFNKLKKQITIVREAVKKGIEIK